MISTNTGLFHSYIGVYIKYTAASTFTLGILHRKLTHSNPKRNKFHIPRWFVKDGVEKGDIDPFSLGGFCLPWKSWYIWHTGFESWAQFAHTLHNPDPQSISLLLYQWIWVEKTSQHNVNANYVISYFSYDFVSSDVFTPTKATHSHTPCPS